MSKSEPPKRERYSRDVWDTSDVANHFGCSRPHVVKLAEENGLPHMRLGRLWRFRRLDVLAWEADQVKKKGAA